MSQIKERLYRLIKHCNKEQIKRVSEGHRRQFELWLVPQQQFTQDSFLGLLLP